MWKRIPGYENLYSISNSGELKSFYYSKDGKIIKQARDNHGYCIVTLVKDKQKKTATIHRLVASSFVKNDNGFPCVNHKDANKSNNNANNLEWVSYKQNTAHAMNMGLMKFNTIEIAEKKRKRVAMVDSKTNKVIKEFESAHQAARDTGLNRGNISTNCREAIKGKTVGSFEWRYI